MKEWLGVKISYTKAYNAKALAMTHVNGTNDDAYRLLPQCCKNLEKTNPNSITCLERTPENKFLRVFIAYGASIAGFASCCPLLGLDGTHLKTQFQGILLAATAADANGSLFPLAYAVVDAENDDNWLWMLKLVYQAIQQSTPHLLEGLDLLSPHLSF